MHSPNEILHNDAELDLLLAQAFVDDEPAVPAGLHARMLAWTTIEMESQRAAIARPRPVAASAFRDFGVLNTGSSSKRAIFVSFTMNAMAVALMLVIAAAATHITIHKIDTISYVNPAAKPPVPAPKPPTPRELPQPNPQPVIEQPRIDHTRIDAPPTVHPIMAAPSTPTFTPPAPSHTPVVAISTPSPVAIQPMARPTTTATAASPVNIARLNSPATSAYTTSTASAVSLGHPAPGNTSATASAPSTVHISGSPQPGSTTGRPSPVSVATIGPVGPPVNTAHPPSGAIVVQIAPTGEHLTTTHHAETIPAHGKPPVITFLPQPAYTGEARALHLEGDVHINVRFLANGSIDVLSVAKGLGHGLNQEAMKSVKDIRFKPATDPDGKPIDYATTVIIHFQQF